MKKRKTIGGFDIKGCINNLFPYNLWLRQILNKYQILKVLFAMLIKIKRVETEHFKKIQLFNPCSFNLIKNTPFIYFFYRFISGFSTRNYHISISSTPPSFNSLSFAIILIVIICYNTYCYFIK